MRIGVRISRIVADTGVLIDFLQGQAPPAERVALELDRRQLRTTVSPGFDVRASQLMSPSPSEGA
jgi:hypothetical protein